MGVKVDPILLQQPKNPCSAPFMVIMLAARLQAMLERQLSRKRHMDHPSTRPTSALIIVEPMKQMSLAMICGLFLSQRMMHR